MIGPAIILAAIIILTSPVLLATGFAIICGPSRWKDSTWNHRRPVSHENRQTPQSWGCE